MYHFNRFSCQSYGLLSLFIVYLTTNLNVSQLTSYFSEGSFVHLLKLLFQNHVV